MQVQNSNTESHSAQASSAPSGWFLPSPSSIEMSEQLLSNATLSSPISYHILVNQNERMEKKIPFEKMDTLFLANLASFLDVPDFAHFIRTSKEIYNRLNGMLRTENLNFFLQSKLNQCKNLNQFVESVNQVVEGLAQDDDLKDLLQPFLSSTNCLEIAFKESALKGIAKNIFKNGLQHTQFNQLLMDITTLEKDLMDIADRKSKLKRQTFILIAVVFISFCSAMASVIYASPSEFISYLIISIPYNIPILVLLFNLIKEFRAGRALSLLVDTVRVNQRNLPEHLSSLTEILQTNYRRLFPERFEHFSADKDFLKFILFLQKYANFLNIQEPASSSVSIEILEDAS